jgi:hypothetical protein
MCVNS